MALHAIAGACTVAAGVYAGSTTDVLTLALTSIVALVPLLIVGTAAVVWQLVRRRREIRFGRREPVVTTVAAAAVVVAAVAIGAAASDLS